VADDLAIILVSHSEAGWLRGCLTSVLEHAGGCELDVVVACNGDDGSDVIVEREFPEIRALRCENRGFAHANNRGLLTCDARYVLFLNVDTEIRDGTFEELVCALDERPQVGLIGVRQVTPEGAILPSIRRFPNALRAFFEALGSERFPFRASWLGERELRLDRYERELECDWTSGSFMLARREALLGAGLFDERFFLYGEEADLCLRIRQAGWEIRHLPLMTIVHHAGRGGTQPRLVAQETYARLQHARKHFGRLHRAAYRAAVGLRYLRRYAPVPGAGRGLEREASRAALAVVFGGRPPFGPIAETALAAQAEAPASTVQPRQDGG
jgi:N-acetylglucosaminyl-diphospho-decaprenol L-rhamnosyltransferase